MPDVCHKGVHLIPKWPCEVRAGNRGGIAGSILSSLPKICSRHHIIPPLTGSPAPTPGPASVMSTPTTIQPVSPHPARSPSSLVPSVLQPEGSFQNANMSESFLCLQTSTAFYFSQDKGQIQDKVSRYRFLGHPTSACPPCPPSRHARPSGPLEISARHHLPRFTRPFHMLLPLSGGPSPPLSPPTALQ